MAQWEDHVFVIRTALGLLFTSLWPWIRVLAPASVSSRTIVLKPG